MSERPSSNPNDDLRKLLKEAVKIIHAGQRNLNKDWLMRARAALKRPAVETPAIIGIDFAGDYLRDFWRERGGEFHGPNVETGTMPESKLLPLLSELLSRAAMRSTQKASTLPTCPHGATEEEVCPECLGAPSDNPDDELANCAPAWAGRHLGLPDKKS